MGGTGKWDGMGWDGGRGFVGTRMGSEGYSLQGDWARHAWHVLLASFGGNMCRKFTHTFPKGLKVPAAFGHKY